MLERSSLDIIKKLKPKLVFFIFIIFFIYSYALIDIFEINFTLFYYLSCYFALITLRKRYFLRSKSLKNVKLSIFFFINLTTKIVLLINFQNNLNI
jgi:hypothetical protein